jgi:hypothetical protein
MNILSTEKLFENYSCDIYTIVEDSVFIDKEHQKLQEVYFFKINGNQKKHPFYHRHHPINLATIIKLDDIYYLTGIDYNDGYRDSRSAMYQLNMEPSHIQEVLSTHDIHNELSFVIDVKISSDKERGSQGILIYIDNYIVKDREIEKYLMTLTTDCSDEYYPSGVIHFNQKLLLDAIPIIEKQLLDKSIHSTHEKQNKVKL